MILHNQTELLKLISHYRLPKEQKNRRLFVYPLNMYGEEKLLINNLQDKLKRSVLLNRYDIVPNWNKTDVHIYIHKRGLNIYDNKVFIILIEYDSIGRNYFQDYSIAIEAWFKKSLWLIKNKANIQRIIAIRTYIKKLEVEMMYTRLCEFILQRKDRGILLLQLVKLLCSSSTKYNYIYSPSRVFKEAHDNRISDYYFNAYYNEFIKEKPEEYDPKESRNYNIKVKMWYHLVKPTELHTGSTSMLFGTLNRVKEIVKELHEVYNSKYERNTRYAGIQVYTTGDNPQLVYQYPKTLISPINLYK